EFAAAAPAAQQADEQRTAVSHRARHHRPLHVRIPGDDRQVAIILLPGDVAIVVVLDQDRPVLAPARDAVDNDFAAAFDAGAGKGPSEDIGPGINWIGQQPMDGMVAWWV